MAPAKRILIVDDDIDFSKLARMVLIEKGGFEVEACNQSGNAINVIKQRRPDLILLDIMMPDKDGTEIAAELRQDPKLCTIPIIFFTSLMTPEEATGHPVIGKYQFIPKPIKAEDLLKRVKDFFHGGK